MKTVSSRNHSANKNVEIPVDVVVVFMVVVFFIVVRVSIFPVLDFSLLHTDLVRPSFLLLWFRLK